MRLFASRIQAVWSLQAKDEIRSLFVLPFPSALASIGSGGDCAGVGCGKGVDVNNLMIKFFLSLLLFYDASSISVGMFMTF